MRTAPASIGIHGFIAFYGLGLFLLIGVFYAAWLIAYGVSVRTFQLTRWILRAVRQARS